MSPHAAAFAAAARAWAAYRLPIKNVAGFWWSNLASLSLIAHGFPAALTELYSPTLSLCDILEQLAMLE